MLLTRSSMLETLGEDYILTARAKGLAPRTIRDKHAARNAMLPVSTSFVLGLAFVIGGGIVTETVFGWPGMGQLLLASTRIEDIPVTVGVLGFIRSVGVGGPPVRRHPVHVPGSAYPVSGPYLRRRWWRFNNRTPLHPVSRMSSRL